MNFGNLGNSFMNMGLDFIKSKAFEFFIEPPKFQHGSLLNESDYDKSKDLSGDNRAWNKDYMKNLNPKTSNHNITETCITHAPEFKQLRQQLEQSNQNFKDHVFPPADKSILGFMSPH